MASAFLYNKINIYDMNTYQKLITFKLNTIRNSTDVIKSTCFSKDGTKFAAGSVLKIIKI